MWTVVCLCVDVSGYKPTLLDPFPVLTTLGLLCLCHCLCLIEKYSGVFCFNSESDCDISKILLDNSNLQ